MTTQISHVSTYGRYVGRVGALAAALGIGVFVVTSPGVASADTPAPSTTSSDGVAAHSPHPARTIKTALSGLAPKTTATDGTATNTNASGATSALAGHRLRVPDLGHIVNQLQDASTLPLGGRSTTPAATLARVKSSSGRSATSGASATPSPSLSRVVALVQKAENAPVSIVRRSARVTDNVTSAVPQLAATTTAVNRVLTSAASAAEDVPATLAAPVTQITTTGAISFLNHVVTHLLDPFLGSAPSSPGPVTPITWAVLGWVRRNVFNEAPTVTYDPTTTVQTGQTVTGNIGAVDPEGDKLTYTITQAPTNGTLTIDQATGNFTYTPDKIDYNDVQTDSFAVSVTDGKTNLLSLLGDSHTAESTVDITVQPPSATRTIVNLPPGFTNASIPRFAADGQSLLFTATPPDAAAGARQEIYQVNVDGTGLTCVTCGLADPTPLAAGTTAPRNLFKPVPFEDGSGRILMQSVSPASGSYTNVVYEPATATTSAQLVRVITPPGKPGVVVVDPQREMRISPDGTHVLFSQIQLVPNPTDPPGFLTSVPIVGTLTPGVDASGNKVYNITNAQVVYPVGEGKQFTHDGKGVIVQGGLYDAGNVDDVEVDLATGNVTRLTGNLDYDEDADLSPNNQWIAIDSGRGQEMLTPVSRVQRPAFVPLLIQGSVYTAYAGTSNYQNVTNQPTVIAVADDVNGEDGLPLFVDGDGWTARSMPSWSADGTEVAFWEANATGQSRLVVSNLEYTTSAAPPLTAAQKVTPALSSSFPTLTSNVPQQVALPDAGTVAAPKIYAGAGGGTAAVAQTIDPTTGHIVRTVVYTDYVNEDGLILNGTESTDQSAAQNTIHYVANVQISGTQTGSLTGDVTINKLTRTITTTTPTSQIQSTLDGDTQVLFGSLAEDRASV